jgi:cytochrome c-type biogenesis protein CcmF
MKPGDSAKVGDYTVIYDRPTQSIDAKEQKLSFGAVLAVDRDGNRFATLQPARNYYSSTSGDPTIAGFFEGEATSEVGRKTRVGGDLWTAMRPDLAPLDPVIAEVDRKLAASLPEIGSQGPTPAQVEAMRAYTDRQGQVIRNIAALYVANPLPVDFRVNVNPFVIWIWIGGAIAVIGALIAVWPAPEARRRRVADVYAARLARDLGRA